MKQLDHYETMRLIRPIDSALMLCVCGVTSENLGLMLRTADVFAVRHILYYGDVPGNESKIRKISRGAATLLTFTDNLQWVDAVRDEGYRLIALEITDASAPLRTFAFPEKTCLIVGNERHGVPQALLDRADGTCYIEMYGSRIFSLNVSVSTAIAVNRYMELQHGESH